MRVTDLKPAKEWARGRTRGNQYAQLADEKYVELIQRDVLLWALGVAKEHPSDFRQILREEAWKLEG